MSKKDKVYKEYLKVASAMSLDIINNIDRNGGSPPEIADLFDEISSLINEHSGFVSSFETPMLSKDFEDADNIIRRNLMELSTKYEGFVPDDSFTFVFALKIAKLVMYTQDEMK